MKQVAVIIINYTTSKLILEWAQGLVTKTSEAIPYEIIIVDNNSELSDYKNFKKHFLNSALSVQVSYSNNSTTSWTNLNKKVDIFKKHTLVLLNTNSLYFQFVHYAFISYNSFKLASLLLLNTLTTNTNLVQEPHLKLSNVSPLSLHVKLLNQEHKYL